MFGVGQGLIQDFFNLGEGGGEGGGGEKGKRKVGM